MADYVKVYGVWASPFSRRVEIALKLKGVEYEFVEVDLDNKGEELLKYNPIHKKIPVLVHNGKPIVESLVILEYIDETWKEHPILPSDPYERSQARFWAKFIDEKIMAAAQLAYFVPGGDTEKATQDLQELFTVLENHIKETKCNAGNTVDYVDISSLFVTYWLPVVQEIFGKDALTRNQFPGIYEWADKLLDNAVVKENLPEREKLISVLKARFAPK